MVKVFEIIMAVSFCLGLIFLIINRSRRKSSGTWSERVTVLSMGIGFVVGVIQTTTQDAYPLAVIYAIGAALSCIAAILAFKKH